MPVHVTPYSIETKWHHLDTGELGNYGLVLPGDEVLVVMEMLQARERIGRGYLLRVASAHVVNAHVVVAEGHPSVPVEDSV